MKHPRLIPAAAGAICVLLLVACSTPGADPTPSPAPSANAAETVAPTADPVTAVLVTLSTESLTITNDNNTVASTFTYFDAADTVATAFTAAFGTTPTYTDVTNPSEGFPYRLFEWKGFILRDESAYALANPPYGRHLHIGTTTREVGGVKIQAADGTAVGDETGSVLALYPDTNPFDSPTGDGTEYYFFETDRVEIHDADGSPVLDADGSAVSFFTGLVGVAGGGITGIGAPSGGPSRF